MLFFHGWDATVEQLHYKSLQSAKILSLFSLGEEGSLLFLPNLQKEPWVLRHPLPRATTARNTDKKPSLPHAQSPTTPTILRVTSCARSTCSHHHHKKQHLPSHKPRESSCCPLPNTTRAHCQHTQPLRPSIGTCSGMAAGHGPSCRPEHSPAAPSAQQQEGKPSNCVPPEGCDGSLICSTDQTLTNKIQNVHTLRKRREAGRPHRTSFALLATKTLWKLLLLTVLQAFNTDASPTALSYSARQGQHRYSEIQSFQGHDLALLALEEWQWLRWQQKWQGFGYFHCCWSWSYNQKQPWSSHCRCGDKTSPGSQETNKSAAKIWPGVSIPLHFPDHGVPLGLTRNRTWALAQVQKHGRQLLEQLPNSC